MKTEKRVRTLWVKALGNQRDVPIRFKPELGDIDLTVKGEDRWIYTIVQSVNPGANPVSQMTKWLEVIPKEDHLAIMRQLQEEASASVSRLENRITNMRDALQFYANKENWTIEEDYSGYIVEGFIISDDIEYPPKIPNTFSGYGYGGKKARQALAEDASTNVSTEVNSTKVSSGDEK